jgi:hypothetical protein
MLPLRTLVIKLTSVNLFRFKKIKDYLVLLVDSSRVVLHDSAMHIFSCKFQNFKFTAQTFMLEVKNLG